MKSELVSRLKAIVKVTSKWSKKLWSVRVWFRVKIRQMKYITFHVAVMSVILVTIYDAKEMSHQMKRG